MNGLIPLSLTRSPLNIAKYLTISKISFPLMNGQTNTINIKRNIYSYNTLQEVSVIHQLEIFINIIINII